MTTPAPRISLRDTLLRRESALLLIIIVLSAYGAATIDGFANGYSVMDRSRHLVEIGIIAVPMTLIIATGGIDLSVGSMVAMSAMVGGAAWQLGGANIWVATALMVLTGLIGGLLNGAMAVYLRLAPLVVTLATMAAYRGIAMIVTEAKPIQNLPDNFGYLGSGEIAGTIIPVQWLVLLVAVVTGMVLLHRSWVGEHTLAIGENPKAAVFAAIPVRPITIFIYGLSGFWCGVVAAIYLARTGHGLPDMKGGMELEVIAAVVVGGTRITGGQASVLGTLLGVLLLGVLQYGMDMREPAVPQSAQMVVTGVVVIFAAVLNEVMARRTQH